MYTYSPPQYPASTATCYLTTRLRAARFRAAAPRGDSNTTLRWRQGDCRSRVRPWLTPPHCVAASAQGAVLNSPASRNVLRTSTTYLPAKPERTLLERMADRLSGEVGWPHGDLSRAGTWKGRPPRRKITNDHRRVDPAAPGLGDGAATHLPREAWRTTCPRLTIWEDAIADGLVSVESAKSMRDARIVVTERGRALLHATA